LSDQLLPPPGPSYWGGPMGSFWAPLCPLTTPPGAAGRPLSGPFHDLLCPALALPLPLTSTYVPSFFRGSAPPPAAHDARRPSPSSSYPPFLNLVFRPRSFVFSSAQYRRVHSGAEFPIESSISCPVFFRESCSPKPHLSALLLFRKPWLSFNAPIFLRLVFPFPAFEVGFSPQIFFSHPSPDYTRSR